MNQLGKNATGNPEKSALTLLAPTQHSSARPIAPGPCTRNEIIGVGMGSDLAEAIDARALEFFDSYHGENPAIVSNARITRPASAHFLLTFFIS